MMKTRILIVEDEWLIAESIKRSLQDHNYTVLAVFPSGEEALQNITTLKPDLILMDILLRGNLNGVETVGQIRSRFNIPVIYITSMTEQFLEQAKLTEPYGYINKPIDETELYNTIEIALHKSKMERKLKESEQWLKTTLKSIGEAVVATDISGLIIFMNQIAEELTGWTQSEALKKDVATVFRVINPKTRIMIENMVINAIQTGLVKKLPGQPLLISRNDQEIPIEASAAPIKDDLENISGAVLVFKDISEQQQAEAKIRKLNTQLEDQVAQRTAELVAVNKELKDFAFIVSHDLKAPLRNINMLAEWMREDYGEFFDKKGHEMFELLRDRINRMNQLIDGILEYSRVGRIVLKNETIDLNKMVRQDLSDLISPKDNIQIIIENEFPVVTTDKIRIKQVFQNLISNAVKYIDKPNGIIKLACVESGDFWKFSIADNGPGIHEKDFIKIFQIFQTLSRQDKLDSTGIGLALVKKLVNLFGGKIWVESKIGEGTTFYFTMPKNTIKKIKPN